MHEFTSSPNFSLDELESSIKYTEAKSFRLSYLKYSFPLNKLGFDELPIGTFPPEVQLVTENKAPVDFEIETGPHEIYVSAKPTQIWVARALPTAKSLGMHGLIRSAQEKLNISIDGLAGPETWRAISRELSLPLGSNDISLLDSRSAKNVLTLQPEVRSYAIALVQSAKSIGIEIKVISGLRTYAEQDDLYAKGRTKPGSKVTNAKGGYSNHNFGIAFDIGVFEGTEYLSSSKKYKAVGALGMQLGLEWGGNWKSIVDEPHFQLRPTWAKGLAEKEMLAELRQRAADGRGFFV